MFEYIYRQEYKNSIKYRKRVQAVANEFGISVDAVLKTAAKITEKAAGDPRKVKVTIK